MNILASPYIPVSQDISAQNPMKGFASNLILESITKFFNAFQYWKISIFWDTTPCNPVKVNRLRNIISQKTDLFLVTDLKTSCPTFQFWLKSKKNTATAWRPATFFWAHLKRNLKIFIGAKDASKIVADYNEIYNLWSTHFYVNLTSSELVKPKGAKSRNRYPLCTFHNFG